MPLYSAQISAAADTALPRDRITQTLHFDDRGLGTDPDGLATDLLAIFTGSWYSPSTSRDVSVKLYDLGDTPPRVPKGAASTGNALAPGSNIPREVALCLSYYAGVNQPRKRGRTYFSPAGRGLSALPLRPSNTLMTDLLDIADALAGLGGADVDWVVYSPTSSSHAKVTDAWVDNEWDTIRSRGMRATDRVTRATGA